MKAIDTEQTIGEIVTQNPNLADVFEEMGIDYCCRGRTTFANACREKGIDPRAMQRKLAEVDGTNAEYAPPVDVMAMSLTELVNHIENTHHAYLHEELPRLAGIIRTVVSTHAEKDPRLHQVAETYRAMALELWCHMFKEENCLFPKIRQIEASDCTPSPHCGTVTGPIRQMETEHDDAGSALERLRDLTDGFSPPEWACKTYRGLLAALAYLERDMHAHIHKENNVLFPSALKMEALRQRGVPVA